MQNQSQIDLLYSTIKSGASFNRVAYEILGYKGPTMVIIRHIEKNDRENNNQTQSYVFGGFNYSQWFDELGYGGDDQAYIFSIKPNFHNYFHFNSQGGMNYCYLNTKKIERSQYKVGLGFGGENYSNYRIWIDDDIETQSYVQEDDKTYELGPLTDYHIHQLNIDLIEIWGLGGQNSLMNQEIYRYEEKLKLEKMRKVDKKQFLNGFDQQFMLGKTFGHRENMSTHVEQKDQNQEESKGN